MFSKDEAWNSCESPVFGLPQSFGAMRILRNAGNPARTFARASGALCCICTDFTYEENARYDPGTIGASDRFAGPIVKREFNGRVADQISKPNPRFANR